MKKDTLSDPDYEARRRLRAHRGMATGLLTLMGLGTVMGYMLPAYGWLHEGLGLEVFRAGAKAGLIGGLADWFAVTALFRYPLGLPIPHTAIIPRQKDQLAAGFGRFVGNHILTHEDVVRALDNADVAAFVGRWLCKPETLDQLTHSVVKTLPGLLDRLEDGRAGAVVQKTMPLLLNGNTAAPVITRALRALVESEQHQEVLSFFLGQIKETLKAKEEHIRELIRERVREQGGRFVGWAIGGSVASKVLVSVNKELERIDPDNSALREGFTQWVRSEIDRIEHDEQRRQEVVTALSSIFLHESLRNWGGDLWGRFRQFLDDDIKRPDGWCENTVRDIFLKVGQHITEDPQTQQRLKEGLARVACSCLPFVRAYATGFIGSVVSRWDAEKITQKVELHIGKDLQYIRINGTIVGCLIGVFVFLLLHFLAGSAIE